MTGCESLAILFHVDPGSVDVVHEVAEGFERPSAKFRQGKKRKRRSLDD